MKAVLSKIKNIKTAFIFGSFAKKNEDSLSDIDLMIIGNPDEDLLIPEIIKIENGIGREINYHIFSAEEWAEKIKQKDNFIENILSGEKIFLIGEKNGL